MHSIASVRSAGGAAKYFTNDDLVSGEYYTAEQAGEVSQWGGEGQPHRRWHARYPRSVREGVERGNPERAAAAPV